MRREVFPNEPRLRSGSLLRRPHALGLLCLAIAVTCQAEEAEEPLRTNPFLRPALGAGEVRPADTSGPNQSTSPPSRLRFTLAAGPESLVNVDGKTLRLGETINGYRLEAVRATSAIFSNGEKVIELQVQPKDKRKAK